MSFKRTTKLGYKFPLSPKKLVLKVAPSKRRETIRGKYE